jgi:hypothetical protein
VGWSGFGRYHQGQEESHAVWCR